MQIARCMGLDQLRFVCIICMLIQKVLSSKDRGVARGGAGGARALPEFVRSVNPIQTMGGRLCPSTTASPPRFKMLSTPLTEICNPLSSL